MKCNSNIYLIRQQKLEKMPSTSILCLTLLSFPGKIFALLGGSYYVVDLESGSLCPDNDQLEIPMKSFRLNRVNSTHRAFTMEFSYAHPIDETAEGTYLIEKWSDGGWKHMPIMGYQKDPCRYGMMMFRSSMIKYGKAMGLEHPDRCPIPAGNYTLKDIPVKVNAVTPLKLWNGRFKATLVLRRIASKQKISCLITILNISEKMARE